MRGRRRADSRLRWLAWLLAWLLIWSGSVRAAPQQKDLARQDCGWMESTLRRFFGRTPLSGDRLAGEGLELAGSYFQYEGRRIEVVIVHPVRCFDSGWDSGQSQLQRLLNSVSGTFRDYTNQDIIRQYLLFKAGDRVVPFDLADSERLLRELPFINDVRLIVVPLAGEPDQVAVVVETTDRWPLGATSTVVNKDRWRAKLYSTNVAGWGLFWGNELLLNRGQDRTWGYHGQLLKTNLAGSFWNESVDWEHSWRQESLVLALDRPLVHPGLNFIGGAGWLDRDDFQNDGLPNGYHQSEVWAGEVLRLYDHRRVGLRGRPVLVPAVRVLDRQYYHRPPVSRDSQRRYHDRTQYLVSLSWQQLKNYKTSFLFGEGEVENIATGWSAKMTGGVEHGEFERRPGLFLDSRWVSMRNRGDVAGVDLSLGAFLQDGRRQDGVFNLGGAYYSALLGKGDFRFRLFWALRYTRGFGRHPGDRIYLGNETGVDQLEDRRVSGNQRLVVNSFYRLFTPWSLGGFRLSLFSFADAGLMGREKEALLEKRIYVSGGLGLRFRNPSLVFPTVEFRAAMVSRVEDPGFRFTVNVGQIPGPDLRYPNSKPSTLAYE